MGMKKRIFIFGIFSLFVNINFLASEEMPIYKLIVLGDQMVGKSYINFQKIRAQTKGAVCLFERTQNSAL